MRRLTLFVAGSVMLGLLAVTLAACGGAAKSTSSSPVASSAVVSTLAGGAGVQGSADGRGAAARFNCPTGIAVDAAGNLYVADQGDYTIRKITSAEQVTTLAGKAGSHGSADGVGAAARFDQPTGISVDAADNLFVADSGNETIRKITPAGMVSTLAGRAGVQGSADGAGAAARFNLPVGIACDAAGNLYVADNSNNSIRKITPAGLVTTLAGKGGLNEPIGVAVDAVGNLYVSDQGDDTIRKITPAGQVTTSAGNASVQGSADGVGAAASFNDLGGIARDAAGNLYVADQRSDTIRKITPAGQVTTIAGTAGVQGSADGVGAAARFNTPAAVTCDALGNLYVVDSGNNTIRKITLNR